MLPQFFKDLIIQNLNKALPTVNSWLSIGINEFIINKDKKTYADYVNLLAELQEIINTSPLFMKSELGESFEFFKVIRIINVPTSGNQKDYSNVDKMLTEIFDKSRSNFFETGEVNPVFDMLHALSKKQQENKRVIPNFKPGAFVKKEEPIINNVKSIRNTHIDAVGKCYEDLKDLVRNALCDMHPAPHANATELNYNIGKIYEHIAQLRNLACKDLTAL